MNKTNLFTLSVFVSIIFVGASCFKAPTANSSRSSTTPDKTSTPGAEKSVPPANSPQTSPAKSGDFGKAVSDFNAKNYDQAILGFKEVLKDDPNNADAHYYLGNIYYIRQNYETSLPYFEQAAKLDYKSVEKLMALGENQRTLKKYDLAIVQYQKVIGFAPGNANAYYGAGLTYIGLNNKIAARQQLQKLEPLNKALADKLSKQIESLK
jgi:tetratricopeptide (TPR) repeat protein